MFVEQSGKARDNRAFLQLCTRWRYRIRKWGLPIRVIGRGRLRALAL
jgi:hypothetical protein